MKSTTYSQGDTSYPKEMSNFPTNIYPQGQNIPQGPISKIMPHGDESYNKAIDSILKCIDVLECFIKNSKVKKDKVQLTDNGIFVLRGIFDESVFINIYGQMNNVYKTHFLCCRDILLGAINAIRNDFNSVYDAECEGVCKGLEYLASTVFSDKNEELMVNAVISFSDFSKVVDVAFKLYSFFKKNYRYRDCVSSEPICDGQVCVFLNLLQLAYISVNGVIPIKEEDISNKCIYNNIKNYLYSYNIDNLFGFLESTMCCYYYFHNDLVYKCGGKVKFESGIDFHSLFVNLIECLCDVYDIFEKVRNDQGQNNFRIIGGVDEFKIFVETIKRYITEIFKFISRNSDFLNSYTGCIEEGKIEQVKIEASLMDSKGNVSFLNLVNNIIKNGDYFKDENASSDREDDVKKHLGDIIDNVTSDRSGCCCSCQVRRR